MAITNFANLDGMCFQKANPGGLRRVLIMNSAYIDGVWPKEADITAGEITVAPTYLGTPPAKWAEFMFPDGTAEVMSDANGDAGFQSYKHAIELMIAGYSKAVQAELKKLLNAGAVFIVEMNDSQYVVVGSSDNPIFVKASFKGGKKGNDKRGFTLKGEQDGFMWDLLPLATSVATALPIQPAAAVV